MKINPETLARASSRHPWRTVGIWAVILVAGFAASGVLLDSALTTDIDFTNNPEAKRAAQILEEERLEQDLIPETIILTGGDGAVQDPAFAETVNAALDDLRALGPDVVMQVPSAFPLSEEEQSDPQVAALGPIPSEDGSAVLFTVILAGDSDQAAENVGELETIRERYSEGDTADVHARRADLHRGLQGDLGGGPPQGRIDRHPRRHRGPDRRLRGPAGRRDADRHGRLRDRRGVRGSSGCSDSCGSSASSPRT